MGGTSVSYPQQWPPQPPQHPPQWPPPYPPPGPYPPPAAALRKTNVVLIVVLTLAAVVVLVPVALVGFFVIQDMARDGRGESKKATSLSDFDVVCDRGSISNAATYGKPYKISAFAPYDEPDPMRELTSVHWSEVALDSRADYRMSPDDFQSVNVVACLTRKPGTEVRSRTCDFKTDAGEHVAVDYYAVQYDIELREARTGKHIEQLGAVDGPAASCPFLVWIEKRDPKMYAEPDPAAVNAKLAEFAHR
ncbi:hypothetical protein [Mycobacterium seoulense]|uniref:hypothetical protein n=1 Tax=Mycobacterium seoulense TaxID=386911 RepID=UPI003CF98941